MKDVKTTAKHAYINIDRGDPKEMLCSRSGSFVLSFSFVCENSPKKKKKPPEATKEKKRVDHIGNKSGICRLIRDSNFPPQRQSSFFLFYVVVAVAVLFLFFFLSFSPSKRRHTLTRTPTTTTKDHA